MTNTGLTAGDIMALTKDNDGFLEGNGIIILILFFLIFGFNGWGNRNGSALTQAELQAGLYNQTTDRNLSDIRTAQCNTDMLINNASYNSLIQSKELSAQLANCCCENRLGIANLGAQINQNTCDVVTAIHAEGEATRQLIQTNEIQSLRDKVSALEMDNRFYGVVRYPNGYTYNAGNSPFCGCNNGCGCM